MPESNNHEESPVPNKDLGASIKPEYANIASIMTTKWDVQIVFGHRSGVEDSFPVTGVVMSHLHAKEFAGVLTRAIKNLEEIIGEIEDTEPKIAEHNRKVQEEQGTTT